MRADTLLFFLLNFSISSSLKSDQLTFAWIVFYLTHKNMVHTHSPSNVYCNGPQCIIQITITLMSIICSLWRAYHKVNNCDWKPAHRSYIGAHCYMSSCLFKVLSFWPFMVHCWWDSVFSHSWHQTVMNGTLNGRLKNQC